MAELRRDPIVGRWVIVDTDHPSKPEEFERRSIPLKAGTALFATAMRPLLPERLKR